MFNHIEYDDHEEVLIASDKATGLKAMIAIHRTTLGPAFGGCRMYPYASDAGALTDVLRLSRGMTYKSAIAELPYGGGKAVIIGDPRREKTPELLHAMGRLVESLDGRYITADDVGTTLGDLGTMRAVTQHTAAATELAQEPLAVTAFGVFMAITAAAERLLGRSDLEGLRVAVQGLGNVGLPLCERLHDAGAQLVVADVDPERAAAAARDFGAKIVSPDDIYAEPVDILAPCALGAVLNDATIARLQTKIVCGGANNQLAEPRHDAALAAREIVFIPDYLVSAGGVIDFYQESIDPDPQAVLRAVERIHHITRDVIDRARTASITPAAAADLIVRQRLAGKSPAFA